MSMFPKPRGQEPFPGCRSSSLRGTHRHFSPQSPPLSPSGSARPSCPGFSLASFGAWGGVGELSLVCPALPHLPPRDPGSGIRDAGPASSGPSLTREPGPAADSVTWAALLLRRVRSAPGGWGGKCVHALSTPTQRSHPGPRLSGPAGWSQGRPLTVPNLPLRPQVWP